MAFKAKRTRSIVPEVEMTPMIDIIFLLIIFFMVAAQFARQAHVDLHLPEETGEPVPNETQSNVVINITEDGTFLLDDPGSSVSLVELDLTIEQLVGSENGLWSDITIRADQNTAASSLNDVLRLLNKHGLDATRIATEKP